MFSHTAASFRRTACRLQSRAAFSTEAPQELRLVDGLIRQRRPRRFMPHSTGGGRENARVTTSAPPPEPIDEEAANKEIELAMRNINIKAEPAPSLDFSAALTRGNNAQNNLGVIENIHEDNVRLEPLQFHLLLSALLPYAGDERARVKAAEEWLAKHAPALVPNARQISRVCGVPVLREHTEHMLVGTWE